ncbi:hypothetical protein BGZ54_006231 [Gamsiella multidivaricata]|nr:hypothetical protein BGZ54_006231 [Gamsiella multidivaricata]
MQLLRVSGTAVPLVTNPEAYTFNEDPSNLMPWGSDSSVKIDRFDGRALLDYLPSATAAMIESGLRLDRDEDGAGNELRFQRWHDLVDKERLHVSEEQCLIDNEEEWNELVARHQALIGKTPEKKHKSADASSTASNFAFNYGTEVVHDEKETGRLIEKELSPLEEDHILDHLDDLSQRERDILDSLGSKFNIQDYHRLLRIAKTEQDQRVMQLKVAAVNLERTLAGKRPLKASEIESLHSLKGRRSGGSGRRGRRNRSSSPAYRSTRRSSPSYEPYRESSSHSASASPKEENVEFIVEFQADSEGEGDGSWMDHESSLTFSSTDTRNTPSSREKTIKDPLTMRRPLGISLPVTTTASNSNATSLSSPVKLSLAEKLKQRMRQGLDQSIRSNEIKRQAKEREQELSQARQKGDVPSAGQDSALMPLEKKRLDTSPRDPEPSSENTMSERHSRRGSDISSRRKSPSVAAGALAEALADLVTVELVHSNVIILEAAPMEGVAVETVAEVEAETVARFAVERQDEKAITECLSISLQIPLSVSFSNEIQSQA